MRKGKIDCREENFASCSCVFKLSENKENILDHIWYLSSFLFTSLVLSVTASNNIANSDDEETDTCDENTW